MEPVSTIIKIVALDPGITTGYAVGLIENGHMGVISGQAKWSEYELYLELKRSSPNVIVYESFLYRNSRHKKFADNVELFPRNLIGVINLYVSERAANGNSCGMYTQTPAAGKGYWNDQLLKKEKVFKIANPHANDAMRHLLQWYVFGAGFQYNKKGFGLLS